MTGWLGRNVKIYFAKDYLHPGQTYEAKARGPQ